MNQTDYPQFAEAFSVSHELQAGGKVLSNAAMFAAFKALSNYPLNLVLSAIDKHIQSARFAVTVADICDLLELGNKRLSAPEAWAEMPKDDRQCGVISEEMLSAWCVCSDLYDNKQYFAAEKSFLSAYDRACKENELMRKPVKWTFSHGNDKANYQTVVERATSLGRLSQNSADVIMLSSPPPATANYAALLSGNLENQTEKNKQKWREVIATLEANEAAAEARIALENREKLERHNAAIAKAMMTLSREEQEQISSMTAFDFYENFEAVAELES